MEQKALYRTILDQQVEEKRKLGAAEREREKREAAAEEERMAKGAARQQERDIREMREEERKRVLQRVGMESQSRPNNKVDMMTNVRAGFTLEREEDQTHGRG